MSLQEALKQKLTDQERAETLVTLVRHPLVEHSLAWLRDKNTSMSEFRKYAGLITRFLAFEVTKDLKLRTRETTTPLEDTTTSVLADDIVLIPVLRAGLSMMAEMVEILPDAKIGFVGLQRDEKTAVAQWYYEKLPPINEDTKVIILDPMLATGGSANETIKLLKERGTRDIRLACVVTAPEGVFLLQKEHPDVSIYTCAVDRALDERFYICPGLGDWGDRVFGTT